MPPALSQLLSLGTTYPTLFLGIPFDVFSMILDCIVDFLGYPHPKF